MSEDPKPPTIYPWDARFRDRYTPYRLSVEQAVTLYLMQQGRVR